jgi:hypothetical protein
LIPRIRTFKRLCLYVGLIRRNYLYPVDEPITIKQIVNSVSVLS